MLFASGENMSEIAVVDKISNEQTKFFSVIRVESRNDALEMMTRFTKEALKRDDAFDKLDVFIPASRYSRLRNYEIEEYLEEVSEQIGYRIDESCPFNGFSFFDDEQ
jgi:hypothetical protein